MKTRSGKCISPVVCRSRSTLTFSYLIIFAFLMFFSGYKKNKDIFHNRRTSRANSRRYSSVAFTGRQNQGWAPTSFASAIMYLKKRVLVHVVKSDFLHGVHPVRVG